MQLFSLIYNVAHIRKSKSQIVRSNANLIATANIAAHSKSSLKYSADQIMPLQKLI